MPVFIPVGCFFVQFNVPEKKDPIQAYSGKPVIRTVTRIVEAGVKDLYIVTGSGFKSGLRKMEVFPKKMEKIFSNYIQIVTDVLFF